MHAFFDDSNSFNSKGFFCLSGFVSDDSRWTSFQAEWHALLAKYEISEDGLHTAAFMAAERKYLKFKSLGQNGRIEILKEFISVVRRHVLFGVSIGVDSVAYKTLASKYVAKGRDPPELFCFTRVLACLMRVKKVSEASPIALVFDDNEQHSMTFYGTYRLLQRKYPELRKSIAGISFCNDSVVLPLQAADMLAWITTKEIKRGQDAWKDSPYRDILLDPNPAYGIQYETEYWDEELLPDLMKLYANRVNAASS